MAVMIAPGGACVRKPVKRASRVSEVGEGRVNG